MKNLLVTTLMVGCIAGASLGFAQDKAAPPKAPTAPKAPAAPKDAAKPAAGAQDGTPDPMMAAWEKYMAVGPEHAKIAEKAGVWDVQVTSWMAPGAPPMKSTGVSTITMVMGGRFAHESFKGTFMDQPFEGTGTFGYDNAAKKHVMTWFDSMGTGIMMGTGTVSADGKTLTMSTSCTDPMTGKPCPGRSVTTNVDKNTCKTEMFGPDESGKEYKVMELGYARRAAGASAPTTPSTPAAPKAPATPTAPTKPTTPTRP